MPSFAELLRRERRALGLTQAELAERAQLSERAISDMERGLKNPQLATLRMLAAALGLTAEQLAELEAARQARRQQAAPSAEWSPRHNLPSTRTSFVGREQALAEVRRLLGPRASAHDANDAFVAENYVELKAYGAFSAGVPLDLGGGGATHAELCALIRELARSCGSTALALAMHTHQVAATVWRRLQGQPVDGLLRRIAAEQLVLVSTGASDWLDSSGRADRVDGGYRVTARKIFGSGSPAGDLVITTTVYDDPVDGPTVLHFPVPTNAPGVTVLDNWRAMGMRGSGSNDVVFESVFVPDSAVSLRRPRGRWHPFYSVVAVVAQLRDIHGALFHPLQAKRQHRFSGRVAFGLDPVDGIP